MEVQGLRTKSKGLEHGGALDVWERCEGEKEEKTVKTEEWVKKEEG